MAQSRETLRSWGILYRSIEITIPRPSLIDKPLNIFRSLRTASSISRRRYLPPLGIFGFEG